jgi:hypothetical protein
MTVVNQLHVENKSAASILVEAPVDIGKVLSDERQLIEAWRMQSGTDRGGMGGSHRLHGIGVLWERNSQRDFQFGSPSWTSEKALPQRNRLHLISFGWFVYQFLLSSWIHRRGFDLVDQALRDDGFKDRQEPGWKNDLVQLTLQLTLLSLPCKIRSQFSTKSGRSAFAVLWWAAKVWPKIVHVEIKRGIW